MAERWRCTALLAAVTAGLGAVLAGQAQDLPFRVNRIFDRTTVISPGRSARPSASIVITAPPGLRVADTGPSPRLAETTRRRMKQDGSPVAIGTYRVIRSAVMAEERPLLIHLPEDYARTTLRYPVLFHLYGQQVTNYFADAVMTAERLGGTAEIPPMIVVGVANTDRYRDCLPLQADGKGPGGADRFLRFFAEELIPFIDASYRTKSYRVLAGPQAGGAFGLHALVTRPELFNAYLLRIENPFPGTEPFRRFFLDEAAAFVQRPPTPNRFVRIVHESDVDADTAGFVRRLGEIVNGARLEGLRFEVQVEPPSGDFVPLVGLPPGLRAVFAGYRMPAAPPVESLKAIEDYYRAFSVRLGVEVEPPDLVLTFAADSLIERARLEPALELLAYEIRLHPGSLNALWRLGEVNRKLGRLEEARDCYKRFLAIQSNDAALIRKRLAEVEQAIKKQ